MKQETDQIQSQFLNLLENPWTILTQGKKFGIKGAKRFFGIMFLFVSANLLILLLALANEFTDKEAFYQAWYLLYMLAIGIGITALAMYKAYTFLIADAFRVIYENSRGLFKTICEKIIAKADVIIKNGSSSKNGNVSQAINIAEIINEKYKKSPKLLKRAVVYFLEKIPFRAYIIEMHADIKDGFHKKASSQLFEKCDAFIQDEIFGSNNTYWVLWLLPLNTIIQIWLMVRQDIF